MTHELLLLRLWEREILLYRNQIDNVGSILYNAGYYNKGKIILLSKDTREWWIIIDIAVNGRKYCDTVFSLYCPFLVHSQCLFFWVNCAFKIPAVKDYEHFRPLHRLTSSLYAVCLCVINLRWVFLKCESVNAVSTSGCWWISGLLIWLSVAQQTTFHISALSLILNGHFKEGLLFFHQFFFLVLMIMRLTSFDSICSDDLSWQLWTQNEGKEAP